MNRKTGTSCCKSIYSTTAARLKCIKNSVDSVKFSFGLKQFEQQQHKYNITVATNSQSHSHTSVEESSIYCIGWWRSCSVLATAANNKKNVHKIRARKNLRVKKRKRNKTENRPKNGAIQKTIAIAKLMKTDHNCLLASRNIWLSKNCAKHNYKSPKTADTFIRCSKVSSWTKFRSTWWVS